MVTPIGELPLRIRKVKIVGNGRTRPYVVEDQLQVSPFSTVFRSVVESWCWQGRFCLHVNCQHPVNRMHWNAVFASEEAGAVGFETERPSIPSLACIVFSRSDSILIQTEQQKWHT